MRVFALVVTAIAVGRSAAAAELTIALDNEALVAPTTVTLSAKSLSEDPIVSYRWLGLPNAPRCKEERCAINISVASCTSVELEAVNAFGETLTATRAVCANDDRGGEPPRLETVIRDGRASANILGGSDPIAIMRGWVDGVETLGHPLELMFDNSGGCHAIDFFVADRAGRIAIAQKTVCIDTDAPQLWIGGKPSAFLPVGDQLERCAESAHPLGLPITRTGGDVDLGGCSPLREAPRSIEHAFVSASDSRDVESFASAFFAASPASGAPVLFFAEVSSDIAVVQFKELRFNIDLFGGSAPYMVSGESGARIADTFEDHVVVVIDRVNFPLGQERLPLTLRDARGLEAEVAPQLTVQAPNASDPANALSDGAAACVCVEVPRSDRVSAFVLGLFFFGFFFVFVARGRR